MEDFLNNIDALDAIQPIIHGPMKLGLIVIILFCVNSRFISKFNISCSFFKKYRKLQKGSEAPAKYFFFFQNYQLSNLIFQRFYKQQSNHISFDKPSYRIDGHPAQQAIDTF